MTRLIEFCFSQLDYSNKKSLPTIFDVFSTLRLYKEAMLCYLLYTCNFTDHDYIVITNNNNARLLYCAQKC